jgi:hypothetical protein
MAARRAHTLRAVTRTALQTPERAAVLSSWRSLPDAPPIRLAPRCPANKAIREGDVFDAQDHVQMVHTIVTLQCEKLAAQMAGRPATGADAIVSIGGMLFK